MKKTNKTKTVSVLTGSSRWLVLLGLLGLLSLGGGCAPAVFGAGAGVGYKVATDERTAGQQLDDTTVASRVKLKLVEEREVPARRIDVDVVAGVVHLSGLVENEAIKRRAQEIAGATEGVRGVRNNLRVGGRTWGQALTDRRLGVRVKTALIGDDEIKALGIDVDVYLGEVILSGMVATPGLKKKAGELAAGVDGVEGVVNQLKISR